MKTLSILIMAIIILLGDYKQEIEDFQKKMNSEFANADTSPLSKEDLTTFEGLNYYKIDESYKVEAELIINDKPEQFGMKTTTSRRPIYIKYGTAIFSLQGKSLEIGIYKNIELSKKEQYKDYLFLLFTDKTSGVTSYGGGRYIDLKIPKDGEKFIIDFNKAYNPYCAYNHRYSCPIPSNDDYLDLAVKAGVMKFH